MAAAWLWTILLNGPLAAGAYLAARDGLRQPAGWPRTLAAAVLGWAWMTLGMIALGSLGRIGRGPLLAWSLAGLGAAVVARAIRGPAPVDGEAVKAPGGEWRAPATVALGLTLWAAAVTGVPSMLMPVKVVSDGPIYHLYFAARWWKEGRLVLVPTPFGETAAPYFPAGGDLWFAWLMTGWGGDRLARVGQAPFLVFAALGAVALARRLGASLSAAVVAAGWFVTSIPLLVFSFEANVDTIFVAGYLASAYFLLRFALGDDGPAALALAGLAAGLAWGSKPTALVFIPPLLALGGVAVLARPGKVGRLAVLGLTTLLMVGFWYGRLLIMTGNPLYPLRFRFLGRTWLPGWFESSAMSRSQFYIPRGDLGALADILQTVLDPRLVPLWLAAVLGAWAIGGRRGLGGWVWLASALAVANVAAYWLFIPYRTQQRFMLQALGLAAVPLARLFDRGRVMAWVGVALLAMHSLTPQSWPIGRPGEPLPWDLSQSIPTVPSGPIGFPTTWEDWRSIALSPGQSTLFAVMLMIGVLAFGVAWTWGRWARRPCGRRLGMAAGASLAAWALVIFGFWLGGRTDRFRFPVFDYQAGWSVLDRMAGPAGTRIAYAGTNLPFYLMGPDFRNEVRYVNIDRHRGWLLHDYHRDAEARGEGNAFVPRPGWDRLRPDFPAWMDNLRAGRIRFLVVGRPNADDGPFNIADADGFPIERVWADAHPETFRLVHGPAQGDRLLRIYRVELADSATERPAGPH